MVKAYLAQGLYKTDQFAILGKYSGSVCQETIIVYIYII